MSSRFKKRKKPNKTKLTILLIVLFGILYLFSNAKWILAALFE